MSECDFNQIENLILESNTLLKISIGYCLNNIETNDLAPDMLMILEMILKKNTQAYDLIDKYSLL